MIGEGKWQPSIIFFDEIDGLAPVRSSRQDYIHSSIVSTLLALMDGLDKRGSVVLIGATNRPDSVRHSNAPFCCCQPRGLPDVPSSQPGGANRARG